MSFIKNLAWRFATKRFDASKKVKPADLKKIIKAIQFSPSSRGLQPFHTYIVSDQEIKNNLRSAAQDQAQVSEAEYVVVFCAFKDQSKLKVRVGDYVKINENLNYVGQQKSDKLRQSMLNTVTKKDQGELEAWTREQVHIALGFALAACAELKIDSCPMGGFERKQVDKVLNLPSYLTTAVLLAVGFRSQGPGRKKVRFPESDLFTFL